MSIGNIHLWTIVVFLIKNSVNHISSYRLRCTIIFTKDVLETQRDRERETMQYFRDFICIIIFMFNYIFNFFQRNKKICICTQHKKKTILL